MWDRLISLDEIKVDHQASVDLDQLKVMVASDLERLLNSRRCLPDDDLFGYPSVRDSVANFGIPDFSTKSLSSGIDRDQMCHSLAKAIEQFDKRLSRVNVDLRPRQAHVHRMAFDIHAVLSVSSCHEPVSFDALFDSAGMFYRVNT